jgi:cytochrome c-type biogenesis protein CcmH/NrfG
VLDFSPDDTTSRYKRAVAFAALGKLDSAVTDLDHVIALDPNHIHARTQRASFAKQAGSFATAIQDLQALRKLTPEHSTRLVQEVIDDFGPDFRAVFYMRV